MERTLLIVKPDGVVRGLVGEVISRVERKGLKIVALKMMRLSKEKAEELYSVHKGKSFFQELIEHITSCLLYTSPSPRDLSTSRMPSSA